MCEHTYDGDSDSDGNGLHPYSWDGYGDSDSFSSSESYFKTTHHTCGENNMCRQINHVCINQLDKINKFNKTIQYSVASWGPYLQHDSSGSSDSSDSNENKIISPFCKKGPKCRQYLRNGMCKFRHPTKLNEKQNNTYGVESGE